MIFNTFLDRSLIARLFPAERQRTQGTAMNSSDLRYPYWDDFGRQAASYPAGDDVSESTSKPVHPAGRNRLSSLQIIAWNMANWGFRVSDGSVYRAEAARLYREDLHERIEALFADLDEQNARIRAAVGSST